MRPIVKCGLTKAGIISDLHTDVRYRPCSLGGIELLDPIFIQGYGQIDVLIEHFWKLTLSIPLLCTNLSNLQLKASRDGRIL